ncbi:MAG TPA: dTDP-4-dehydrorhamnose reductase [Parachlamydiaceae bacterium]|nr:dTDP-4-dehydrorhamnose reductase [Parachlamydiaceae bacterium]
MKRILITGKDGQVGWELQRTLAPLGKVWAYGRQELDLQDPNALCKAIREIKPDLIVNAAAYTAVDKAEVDQEAAHAVNAIAPGLMAEEAKKCGAVLIHYSTDYVFDGSATKPYLETDLTCPLNIYGKTKLEGELAVQAVSGKHIILRTSWVYGGRGKNFLQTMLRLGKEKKILKVVADQTGAPTWSRLIAGTTSHIASHVWLHDKDDLWGTYHLTSAGQTSWYGFADEIFGLTKRFILNASEGMSVPQLEQMTAAEYPLPATRPQYSVLSNEKLSKTFLLRMPDWKVGLQLCLENN